MYNSFKMGQFMSKRHKNNKTYRSGMKGDIEIYLFRWRDPRYKFMVSLFIYQSLVKYMFIN